MKFYQIDYLSKTFFKYIIITVAQVILYLIRGLRAVQACITALLTAFGNSSNVVFLIFFDSNLELFYLHKVIYNQTPANLWTL